MDTIVAIQTYTMKLRLPLITLLLTALLSCQSETQQQTKADQQPVAVEEQVQAIDEEIETLLNDPTCEQRESSLKGTESKQLRTFHKESDLVMIEEEEISAEQAKVNRYYFKDDQLVFAAAYEVNPCADTTDICVNETRCYFQGDEMICEYMRSISLPLNEDGLLDEEQWDDYLSQVEYENQPLNAAKAPAILERSTQLRSTLQQEVTAEG